MANTIKGRVELNNNVALVKMIITHPMTIDRRDPKTGTAIDGHFIEEVTIKVNGEEAMNMAWGQAISTNPFFSVNLNGLKKGDTINIAWRDNKSQSDATDVTVN
jgi:thiosulfate oxidation carrier complex protein SoxZ